MSDEGLQVTLDKGKLAALGQKIGATFEMYEKDRKAAEETWLRSLRQFRGILDPETRNAIPDDHSTAYPKITRAKVIGTVARLMEMLFPQTEKNYDVQSTPLPELSESDVQKVLDELQSSATNGELTDEVIEKGIKSLADAKAAKMGKVIEDQLAELDYVSLVKRVVFSAVLYGPGVLKGPMVVREPKRTWVRDPLTLKYKTVTQQALKPFYEFTSAWDWYPDMSAKTIDKTDGDFQRHILTRSQLVALTKRPDFFEDTLTEWLRSHASGNYKERHWEVAMRQARSSDKNNVQDMSGRKYEAIEYWGRVSAHELKAIGFDVKEDQLAEELEICMWLLDKTVIKCVMNPYDGRTRGFHVFIYEEDDITLTGNGLPVTVRDSALAIGEAARMILDNASIVCGPMVEINTALLMPGTTPDIYANKAWLRDDTGPDAQTPAVREINVDSHIPDLIAVIELFQGFADSETALPPPALGDVSGQGKEALRTSHNMSMLLGNAALPIRDTVRNFDRFTVSVIGSLIHWNMDSEFNPDESIKGDAQAIARGSTSLIAKELRASALDQFMLTLTPEERMYFKTGEVLKERVKARDLPDSIFEDDKTVQQKLAEQAQNAQAGAAQQAELLRVQIRHEVASAFKDVMLGLKAQSGASAETFTAITEAIVNERDSRTAAAGAGASERPVRATERAGAAGAS